MGGGGAGQGLSPFESTGALAHQTRGDYVGSAALCLRIADDETGLSGKVR